MTSKTHGPRAGDLTSNHHSVVDRLRRGIAEAELDCGCREAANDMLDRVDGEQEQLRRAGGLAEARTMRDAILVVLDLLRELDDLMPDEPDRSVFFEISDLFRDVANLAACGAAAANRAAGPASG